MEVTGQRMKMVKEIVVLIAGVVRPETGVYDEPARGGNDADTYGQLGCPD